MKKRNIFYSGMFFVFFLMAGCNFTKEVADVPSGDNTILEDAEILQNSNDAENSDTEIDNVEENTENNEKNGNAESENNEENGIEESKTGTVSVSELRFTKENSDEESLRNSMFIKVTDREEEKSFLKMFFTEEEDCEVTDYGESVIYSGYTDDAYKIVIVRSAEDAEYPKSAIGFSFKTNDAKKMGSFIRDDSGNFAYDEIQFDDDLELYGDGSFLYPIPQKDYYEVEYEKDENEKLIKAKYSCDSYEYGTYNSSGEVYYNDSEQAVYRVFYNTSGDMNCYWLYDENGALSKYLEYGGSPYTGLKENPGIYAGIDATIYYFE